jgi:quercetin dioxygenase-like cupin family protein/ketosteroid isomerase-like protein
MDRRGRPTKPSASPRPALLAAALGLLLATGTTLAGFGLVLTDPGVAPSMPGQAAANEDLVRDFYAAVDAALRIGTADDLDSLVAPAFVWCRPCGGDDPTLAGLKHHLTDLRRTTPDLRLVVESVVGGSEDTATANVRVAGSPLVDGRAPWGPVDTFRLDGGRIVERRAGPDGTALVDPLAGVFLEVLPSAVTGVALARLTFPLTAGVDGLVSDGPTVLIAESGALALRTSGGGRVLRAGGGDEDWTTAGTTAALATVLRQGDVAVVPTGVRHALAQEGDRPAAVLAATLFFVDEGHDRREPDLPVFSPLDGPGDGSPHPRPLPAVRLLAEGTVAAWPAGPVAVGLGRAVLAAGARVVPAADETALLAVEAGTLDVLGPAERAVAAGNWALLPAGTDRELRNAGDGLVILQILTVAATDA